MIRVSKRVQIYLFAIAAVLIYGAVGTYVLGSRSNFNIRINSWIEALYFTIVTISTVGYGDITPITDICRIFVMVLIIAGLSIFISAVTILSGEFLSSRIESLYSGAYGIDKKRLNGHIVLIGYDSINGLLAERLKRNSRNFIIVTADKTVSDMLNQKGYSAFVADYTLKADMEKFNIEKASDVIVDLRDSSKTVYVVLVVRKISKTVRLSVVAPTADVEIHLEDLNIDNIINPITIGADRLTKILIPHKGNEQA